MIVLSKFVNTLEVDDELYLFLCELTSSEFHPRFLALTGTPDQIAQCARAYRVYSMPGLEMDANSPDYLVDHSVIIYLVGPDNKLVDYFASRQSSDEISKRVIKQVETVVPQSLLRRLWNTAKSVVETS